MKRLILCLAAVCCSSIAVIHSLTAEEAKAPRKPPPPGASEVTRETPMRFRPVRSRTSTKAGVIIFVEKREGLTSEAMIGLCSREQKIAYVYELSLSYDGDTIVRPGQLCSFDRTIVIHPNELVVMPVRFSMNVHTDPAALRRERGISPFLGGGEEMPKIEVASLKVSLK